MRQGEPRQLRCEARWDPGSKLTGGGKARQQMLKLWGLSWLTSNHHSGFYVACPLTKNSGFTVTQHHDSLSVSVG